MKEKIYEEYGYKVSYVIYRNDNIYFELNDSKYMILKTELNELNLLELDKIINYLDNYAIFFHKLVVGKNGFSFQFENNRYVLLKLRIISEREITINEIVKLSNIKINWESKNILENKIDFLEQYLANYENLELEDINYFIGLTENAITIFNIIGENDKKYIGHKRIHCKESTLEFYNPLNIVVDYRSRDLAEYAKSLLLNGVDKTIEFLKYLDYSDWYSYFARIMYPSFYFDLVDNYINKDIKIDKKRINILVNSYEKTIKKLYEFLKIKINIPYIEWLDDINNF